MANGERSWVADSPPPCGAGLGVGVAAVFSPDELPPVPLPQPPPARGGGVLLKAALCSDSARRFRFLLRSVLSHRRTGRAIRARLCVGVRSSSLNLAARFARPVAIVIRLAWVSAVCAGEPQVPDRVRASHGPGPRRFTCSLPSFRALASEPPVRETKPLSLRFGSVG